MFTPRSHTILTQLVLLGTIAFLLISTAESAPSKGSEIARPPKHVRIVNGTVIPIEDAPYIVQITDPFGYYYCAGTLISPQYVVTAAHGLKSLYKESLRITAGVSKQTGNYNVERHEVENFWLHPDYVPNSNDHMDVAVIKLRRPIAIPKDSKTIKTIEMCKRPLKADDSIQVVGWGKTSFESNRLSNDLMSIIVPVISKKECLQMTEGSDIEVTESMVCAGKLGYQDACQGDSGGPAVRRGKLCAIVSWGVNCADDEYPGIYTSIPVVRDFIDKCMKL